LPPIDAIRGNATNGDLHNLAVSEHELGLHYESVTCSRVDHRRMREVHGGAGFQRYEKLVLAPIGLEYIRGFDIDPSCADRNR
jgi:hypothetical protein